MLKGKIDLFCGKNVAIQIFSNVFPKFLLLQMLLNFQCTRKQSLQAPAAADI